MRRHLYRYVADVVISKDGHAVDMKLLKSVRLRHRRIDGVLAFDLVITSKAATKTRKTRTAKKAASEKPKGPKKLSQASRKPSRAAPPTATKTAAKARAKAAEKTRVRAGQHRKHSRLAKG